MDNNAFDYLIPQLSEDLFKDFFRNLERYSDFMGDIDTSPLLNLTIGVFIGTLINVLDKIKGHTIGEIKLIENIDAYIESLIKSLEELPWVKKIEWRSNA